MSNWGDNPQGPDLGTSAAALGHLDEWAELAVDYLDGSADQHGRAAAEAHVAACPSCSARLLAHEDTSALLRSLPMAEVPEDLEDRILGELLFPYEALPPRQPERASLSDLWHRRLRKWVPAAAAVAAVLVGMVAWGVFNPPDRSQVASEQSAVTSVAGVAPASLSAGSESAPASGEDSAAAATATTAAAMATETTTTVGGSETTDRAQIPPASGGSTPVTISNRNAIVEALSTSSGPVYLVFAPLPAEEVGVPETETVTTALGSSGSTGGGISGEEAPGDGTSAGLITSASAGWMEETVEQLEQFTELKPLPAALSPGQPVYAAYLNHDHVKAFVDLLKAIAASVRLDVCLQTEAGDMGDAAAVISAHKDELPVLLSQLLPQPSVARFSFTTSTLQVQGSDTAATYPDEAGTHVLTIIFMRP